MEFFNKVVKEFLKLLKEISIKGAIVVILISVISFFINVPEEYLYEKILIITVVMLVVLMILLALLFILKNNKKE